MKSFQLRTPWNDICYFACVCISFIYRVPPQYLSVTFHRRIYRNFGKVAYISIIRYHLKKKIIKLESKGGIKSIIKGYQYWTSEKLSIWGIRIQSRKILRERILILHKERKRNINYKRTNTTQSTQQHLLNWSKEQITNHAHATFMTSRIHQPPFSNLKMLYLNISTMNFYSETIMDKTGRLNIFTTNKD